MSSVRQNWRDMRVLGLRRYLFLRYAYRHVMRFAHRFNWHYMHRTEHIMPGNDTMLWCHWCGARYVLPHENPAAAIRARGDHDE